MAPDSDSLNQVPTEEPKLEESWKAVMKEVTLLDNGLIGGWKEDIDTLLVFAGLFSAVVTAFTIESYKWLSEDLDSTTVALLRQITQQMANDTSTTPPPDFEISSSDLLINMLWFLSLIIALVDVLFGLLCKQWLREHYRHTHTRTPAEALALRWLRHESLRRWSVPTILAWLPVLLELALFLFLGGLLELLRTRHLGLFIAGSIIVGLAGLFYLSTTIIPGVHIIRHVLKVTPTLREMRAGVHDHSPTDRVNSIPPMEYICPYKSPQAWITFLTFAAASQFLGIVHFIHLVRAGKFGWRESASAFRQTMKMLTSKWPSVDLEVIHRSDIDLAPPFYELQAFRWLVTELQDSQMMRPHLQKILETAPRHLVMPAVFNKWFVHPDGKWTEQHIADALCLPEYIISPEAATTPDQKYVLNPLTRPQENRQNKLFNRLLYWTHIFELQTTSGKSDPLAEQLRRVWTRLLPIGNAGDNTDPFSSFDEILKDDDTSGAGSDLWNLLMEIGQLPTTTPEYWHQLMLDLAHYIIASSSDYTLRLNNPTTTSSFLVGSKPELLCQAHAVMLDKKIFNPISMDDTMKWIEAIDIIRRVQTTRREQAQHPQSELSESAGTSCAWPCHVIPFSSSRSSPELNFKPIPDFFPLPLSKLRKVLHDLSPADSGTDFGYLVSFQEHWGTVKWPQKEYLVEILSEHINDYMRPFPYGRGSLSPLIEPPGPGLDLIVFVDSRLKDSGQALFNQLQLRNQTAWSQVRRNAPRLSRDAEQVNNSTTYIASLLV